MTNEERQAQGKEDRIETLRSYYGDEYPEVAAYDAERGVPGTPVSEVTFMTDAEALETAKNTPVVTDVDLDRLKTGPVKISKIEKKQPATD
jgi:hypothetical protein